MSVILERSSSGCKSEEDFDKSHDAKLVTPGAKSLIAISGSVVARS